MLSLPGRVVTWPAVAWVGYYGNLSKSTKSLRPTWFAAGFCQERCFPAWPKIIDPINSRCLYSQGKVESFHLAISVCTSHYWMKSKHVCFCLWPGLRRLHICIFLSICTSQHQNPSCTWSHISFCKWALLSLPHNMSCDGAKATVNRSARETHHND